ncbi:MAG: DEAD/DEAH box helicase [Liquorilactobacillus ghanensis]|uniref:DEAD/DEAH box helicase n=1 Tax=Liquorilactobacillus ghanensis TaxID=399370 RepID=UPI0039EABC61
MEFKQIITQAALAGLAGTDQADVSAYTPQLLSNTDQETIWEHLRTQLQQCSDFVFAVAFITADMLPPFKAVMADLAAKKVHGRLITSDYLSFNQPDTLAELLKIPNLTTKIAPLAGFHAKGYWFEHRQPDYQTLIIGSANFTRSALLKNYEWSLELNSLNQGKLVIQLRQEINQLWQQSHLLTLTWLNDYRQRWQAAQQQHSPTIKATEELAPITPNQMQQAALQQLVALRQTGAQRGLVISATGTGKTYLGAFDVKQTAPKRMLFVAHREQILRKAKASFQRVLGGPSTDYGFLSGTKQQPTAKYLFATVQTLAQPTVMQQFEPQTFDYLLIDEAHRSGAASYQRLLDYFQPRFCLGMTATPERTDDYSIFQLFDYNIAYEIRLQDALAAGMLCPFHYIGLQDYEYQGQLLTDKAPLRQLAAPARVTYLLQQLEYYSYSGAQVHGLIFCSRRDEAVELAQALTTQGHPAQALDGTTTIARRERLVKQLEQGKIEYLVTVDVFNEGVDIPCVNQVVMLRNTQSQIVFLQQLGRGLRKFPGKKYLTVLDFIGNYQNNYLIPLALTEDHSLNKDQARSTLALEPIMGLSTITFTEIARQQIYASLQRVKLDGFIKLRQVYQQLQQRLGRIPLLTDFAQQQQLDVQVFAENNQIDNYYQFLNKMKAPQPMLTKQQASWLTFVTQELLNGKRRHELILLQALSHQQQLTQVEYQRLLEQQGCQTDSAVLDSVKGILSLAFFQVKAGKKLQADKYGGQPLINWDRTGYRLAPALWQQLQSAAWFKRLWQDVLTAGLLRAKQYQAGQVFTLYQKYTRKDVCRLLDWPLDVSAPMYGYRVDDTACPMFVTYQNDAEKNARSGAYVNYFLSPDTIRWYTRSPRHLDSAEVQKLLARDDHGHFRIPIYLFIKRSDAEGKDFYYVGRCQILPASVHEVELSFPGKKKRAAVALDLQLNQPLSYKMYRLITGKNLN